MSEKGHSEDYFGEERDFWWNKDYLDLLANRWNLGDCSKLLDVGSGRCHWSKLLSHYIKQPSEIVAYDYDAKWAEGDDAIKDFFRKRNASVSFVQGDAMEIPFPDDYFDIVTCQTVLIHIKNPQKALEEMKRVLKPGGRLICVEPNNVAWTLLKDTVIEDESIEDTINRVKYQLLYEKGKRILGEGDNSLGDLLPGLFAKVGIKDIQVSLSDKASPMIPPYDSLEEQATIKTLEQWVYQSEGELDYQQALRYFTAVSNEPSHIDFFNEQYQKNKTHIEMQLKAIQQGEFSFGGAFVMYIVSGMKK